MLSRLASVTKHGRALGAVLCCTWFLFGGNARAAEPVASFDYLVTGNGHGFQVFDRNANAVKTFLERPYRYMRPNQSNPDGEGVVRRNLVYDAYFGVRAAGQSTWLGTVPAEETGYVDQSNIIRSQNRIGQLTVASSFFAPFGYEGNAMVMILRVHNTGASAVDAEAYGLANFHMGSAPVPDTPGTDGETIQFDVGTGSATETGPGGGTLVYVSLASADYATCSSSAWQQMRDGQTLSQQHRCTGHDQVWVMGKQLGAIQPGESAYWGMALLFDGEGDGSGARVRWQEYAQERGPEALLQAAIDEWESWRTAPPGGLSPDEQRIWRQSESVLRMGQVREAWSESPKRKGHGMVLASLPPGGWHSGWVRDAVYALVALARTGHFEEARMGLEFFLNADAGKFSSVLNDVDYRITTVRYFGNGEEEADYSGQPTRNIEIDGWGLFLWAARVYVDQSGDVEWLSELTRKGDTVYDAMRAGVAEALIGNLESNGMARADASIWEVHWGNREHFLYTTAASARGLCDMAAMARRLDKLDDRDRYTGFSAAAVSAMRTHFVDRNGVLAGSLERLARGSNYRDGAVVEAFVWDLIDAADPIATATMGEFSFLTTAAGGYKRVEGSTDQYDTDEWILIDLRASEAWRRMGNSARADELLAWVTDQAGENNDLIPELYNTRTQSGAIGAYSGSIPMVGYGAGAYMLTVLSRAGRFAPRDCGSVESYPDAGVDDAVDAAPQSDAGVNGFSGRSGVACMCSHTSIPDPVGGLLVALAFVFVVVRRQE